ncbi:MAG: nicotinate (nicotinamide) nucleotide adenylyltransferase [Verrucomicrobia bacterium]|nr:MAG: nicotinate (nicotinamide) nucleotide adenylyltransferase [Verrucomicrobiota bacterium]
MNKIGIYGGTFDPVHHGHLILGRQACEELALDRLIFIPAALSPFKKDEPNASSEFRMSMLRAALDGELVFTVNDCELRRPPPSYSIDTALEIREREPDAELFWLIGADNLSGLSNWHRFRDLDKLVKFVVLDRACAELKTPYQVVQRKIDISATEIRKRVASGRSIRYLVPKAVEEIIRRENLYRESGT